MTRAFNCCFCRGRRPDVENWVGKSIRIKLRVGDDEPRFAETVGTVTAVENLRIGPWPKNPHHEHYLCDMFIDGKLFDVDRDDLAGLQFEDA